MNELQFRTQSITGMITSLGKQINITRRFLMILIDFTFTANTIIRIITGTLIIFLILKIHMNGDIARDIQTPRIQHIIELTTAVKRIIIPCTIVFHERIAKDGIDIRLKRLGHCTCRNIIRNVVLLRLHLHWFDLTTTIDVNVMTSKTFNATEPTTAAGIVVVVFASSCSIHVRIGLHRDSYTGRRRCRCRCWWSRSNAPIAIADTKGRIGLHRKHFIPVIANTGR
mmetsp:Transcript_21783/g.32564  ORF Transcript_21783/g.32564 Transcript_21783/m.32564 type:complete len:226 (+) Transcript_21783:79-756(+)